jgi:hypothetical protein
MFFNGAAGLPPGAAFGKSTGWQDNPATPLFFVGHTTELK